MEARAIQLKNNAESVSAIPNPVKVPIKGRFRTIETKTFVYAPAVNLSKCREQLVQKVIITGNYTSDEYRELLRDTHKYLRM